MTDYKPGVGFHRTRDGRKAEVNRVDESVCEYPLEGLLGGDRCSWTPDGGVWSTVDSIGDLIGPWVEPAPEAPKSRGEAVSEMKNWLSARGSWSQQARGWHIADKVGRLYTCRTDATECGHYLLVLHEGDSRGVEIKLSESDLRLLRELLNNVETQLDVMDRKREEAEKP